jgi:hypothetical protein
VREAEKKEIERRRYDGEEGLDRKYRQALVSSSKEQPSKD